MTSAADREQSYSSTSGGIQAKVDWENRGGDTGKHSARIHHIHPRKEAGILAEICFDGRSISALPQISLLSGLIATATFLITNISSRGLAIG
jgi:hypothetical protein